MFIGNASSTLNLTVECFAMWELIDVTKEWQNRKYKFETMHSQLKGLYNSKMSTIITVSFGCQRIGNMPFNHHNRKLILLINYNFKGGKRSKKQTENDLWLEPRVLLLWCIAVPHTVWVAWAIRTVFKIHSAAGIRP